MLASRPYESCYEGRLCRIRRGRLHSWATAERHPGREEAGRALADDGIACAIVERFGRLTGLWADDPDDQ